MLKRVAHNVEMKRQVPQILLTGSGAGPDKITYTKQLQPLG